MTPLLVGLYGSRQSRRVRGAKNVQGPQSPVIAEHLKGVHITAGSTCKVYLTLYLGVLTWEKSVLGLGIQLVP